MVRLLDSTIIGLSSLQHKVAERWEGRGQQGKKELKCCCCLLLRPLPSSSLPSMTPLSSFASGSAQRSPPLLPRLPKAYPLSQPCPRLTGTIQGLVSVGVQVLGGWRKKGLTKATHSSPSPSFFFAFALASPARSNLFFHAHPHPPTGSTGQQPLLRNHGTCSGGALEWVGVGVEGQLGMEGEE